MNLFMVIRSRFYINGKFGGRASFSTNERGILRKSSCNCKSVGYIVSWTSIKFGFSLSESCGSNGSHTSIWRLQR